jgi:hypothetical protein
MTRPGEFEQAIYAYRTDEGEILTISLKRSLADLVGNPQVPMRLAQGRPERWHFRTITIQTVFGSEVFTRRIVICDPRNPLFRGTQNLLPIDGVMWRVTSRRGEYRRGPFES